MRRAIGARPVTIPNIITLGRFMLVPLIVWLLITEQFALAFPVFVLAGVSDGADGYIARRFNQRSELGAYLDPMADKALLATTYVMLGYLGELPVWLVTLVVSRDVLILGGIMLASLMDNPIEVRPIFVSKANTAVQIALAFVALGELAFDTRLPVIHGILVAGVAALTLASGFAYLSGWMRHMRATAEPDEVVRGDAGPLGPRDWQSSKERERA